MKQFLKTILLVSVLAIFIAGCAEESSNSAPTTSKTAEQVLADFMAEFNAMQGEDIGQLTSSGTIYTTTANITNTRKDNKDAFFVSMDSYLVDFLAVKLEEALIVETSSPQVPGVLISANGNSNATFVTLNSAPKGTHSSICALLTQEEYAVIQELLQAETALTVEQMQTVIDLVKPYVVKINYSVQ